MIYGFVNMIKRENKPWGYKDILILNDKYCIKDIVILPGHRLSLQFHNKKHETIFVTDGTLDLQIGQEYHVLSERSMFDIPPKTTHRFINNSNYCITLREVSSPELDDIVRLDDDYGRKI